MDEMFLFDLDLEVPPGCRKSLMGLARQMHKWLQTGEMKAKQVKWHHLPVVASIMAYRGVDYIVTIDTEGNVVKNPGRQPCKILEFPNKNADQ